MIASSIMENGKKRYFMTFEKNNHKENRFGLKKRETTASISSNVLTTSKDEEEIKAVECQMQGGTWKFGTCVFDYGFGETVVVIGKAINGGNRLSDEEIKKYLPNEFFEEFNLIPFEVWAAQYSMNKGPWVFRPNYNNSVVQIMAQVSSDVQPWLDYGELYLEWTIGMIPIGKSLLPFKFINKVGAPGKEPVHIGLDYARKNIIHYGILKKYGKHIGIWFNKSGKTWKHIFFRPFRIWP